jgi:drug/metabolite transporter (DMT)-like permease
LVLSPVMFLKSGYKGTHAANLRKDWKALLVIGAVNGPAIALNNASLISIELSLNQVIRAGIPVCVACFAFCLERKVPTEIGGAYLLLVTLSVMCVVFTGQEHGEIFGVTMCFTSVLLQSGQMSLSGKLMSGKLDSFQLNFYTGPIAFVVLILMELCLQQETAGLFRFAHRKPAATTGIMLGGCCLALMYNVVLMQAVRTFSSVGTAVLGNFRTVLLIFASALLLGELQTWGASRYIGCINTFVGAAAYGLHPKLFGTPVSRELPKSTRAEIEDVRKEAQADCPSDATERHGLATPKMRDEEMDDHV